MDHRELLWKLEGLHTVETVAETLGIRRQTALNLLSKLKKVRHVTVKGGGRKKRLYTITLRRQLPRMPGMFDIINKYSPHLKINPWYDHQVHGPYGPEEALVDALQTESFRLILASMCLFNHITNWQKLYRLAQQKGCWQKVGALYDVARMFMKVRKMPEKYRIGNFMKSIVSLIRDYKTKEQKFYQVEHRWKVAIPFRQGDIRKVTEL